jgi:hypothetical protein
LVHVVGVRIAALLEPVQVGEIVPGAGTTVDNGPLVAAGVPGGALLDNKGSSHYFNYHHSNAVLLPLAPCLVIVPVGMLVIAMRSLPVLTVCARPKRRTQSRPSITTECAGRSLRWR